jgi:cell division protein FtsB
MKTTSTLRLVIFFSILFSFVFISNGTNAQEKDSSDAKLIDKVALLEKKIQNQQNEIESLKKDIDKLKGSQPWLAVPKIEGNEKFQKGRRFEFNGQVYYMIPLKSDKSKSNSDK